MIRNPHFAGKKVYRVPNPALQSRQSGTEHRNHARAPCQRGAAMDVWTLCGPAFHGWPITSGEAPQNILVRNELFASSTYVHC